jgi:arylsulfatase A-like enzyme
MAAHPKSDQSRDDLCACGLIGKWHLGTATNMRPIPRGFDEFFGFLGPFSQYFNAQVLRNNTSLTEPEYLTDAFTREGVSFINRHATQPFFLVLSYSAPHGPYQAPQSYLDRVGYISDPQRRVYTAMVTALDDRVGQVLQALQAQNLLNKTLIFFLSDNGAESATFTRNYPLRGYKFSVFEGGIRVPFAIQWTGLLPAGTAYDEPVSALDIVPTAAAAAGVSLPRDRVYDGLNVMPYVARQQVPPQRTLFWRWFGLGSDGPPGSVDTIYAVRRDSLKLVQQGALSLFNLSTDIGESQNLAQIQPGDVASLNQLYGQWNAEMIAPLWQQQDTVLNRMVLAGDWNGFNKDDSAFPWRLTKITARGAQGTPDGFDWFRNTIHVAATGGDTTPGTHSFVLLGGNYSTQWGGATINIDATTSIPFFQGTRLGPTNSISLQDGFYYSFRILDWRLNANLTLAVMKTSAPPILASVTGQTP